MLLTAVICVVVVIAYAIYKLSRENVDASASSVATAESPSLPALPHPKTVLLYDLVRDALNENAAQEPRSTQPDVHFGKMIALSTIDDGIQYFKRNYRGNNKDQIFARVDDALLKLKSQYGDEVSVADLREFIKTERRQLFPS